MTLNAVAGAVDANSYVDVTYADAFFATQIAKAVWPSLTPDKESVLIESTRLLDSFFDFTGLIASDEQALRWPRTDVYDIDGRSIASDSIPNTIKQSVCYLALYLLQNGGVNQIASTTTGVKVGPIDIKMTDKSIVGIPEFIIRMLSNFGSYIGPTTNSVKSVNAIRS